VIPHQNKPMVESDPQILPPQSLLGVYATIILGVEDSSLNIAEFRDSQTP
jgi:hypothetical protein